MCLNSITENINLVRRGNDFVGIGYKLMSPHSIGKFGVWQEAGYIDDLKYKYTNLDCNHSTNKYNVGFHIFTNEKHARNYQSDKTGKVLYQVEYKEITAVGKNTTYKNNGQGTCVITRFIRYVKKLESF